MATSPIRRPLMETFTSPAHGLELTPLPLHSQTDSDWDSSRRALRLGVALYRMWDIDDARCTFSADFRIHATWLALPEESSIVPETPEWNFANAVDDVVMVDSEAPKEVHPARAARVWTSSMRYRGTFFRDHSDAQDAAFQRFPMDVHNFDIVVRVPRVHKQGLAAVEADASRNSCETILTRRDAGLVDFCVLDVNAWVFVNEPEATNFKPDFIISASVARKSRYYLVCVYLPLVVISLMSLVSFLMDALSDRVNLVLTAVLCVVAFKFTVASRLPILSSATHLDRYIGSLYALFVAMTIAHVVRHILLLRGLIVSTVDIDGTGAGERWDIVSFDGICGLAYGAVSVLVHTVAVVQLYHHEKLIGKKAANVALRGKEYNRINDNKDKATRCAQPRGKR